MCIVMKPCTTIRGRENPGFMAEMQRTNRWWSLAWLWAKLFLGRLPVFSVQYLGTAPEVICGEAVSFFKEGSCTVRFVRVMLGRAILELQDGNLSGRFLARFPFKGMPEVIVEPVQNATT